jgi:hypothetical protein
MYARSLYCRPGASTILMFSFLPFRYILDPKDFTLTKGSETELTRYQFHRKFVTHVFCPVCGSGLFAVVGANKLFGVNVRNISGIDLEKLTLKKNNGREA